MIEYSFVKGHGTQNDFVLLPDANGKHELTAGQVALLCDCLLYTSDAADE